MQSYFMSENIDDLLTAYNLGELEKVKSDFFCQTRDVFRARHDRWFNILQKEIGVSKAGLILTIIGEVGNNSYDHNLGHWQTLPGLCFYQEKGFALLFDCGRGIEASLSGAGFKFENEKSYLNAALTQRITGRAPERRGNGLKVSLEAVESLDISFYIRSGQSEYNNQKMNHPYCKKASLFTNKGVLMMLDFRNLYEN
jgi:hypothetical protein